MKAVIEQTYHRQDLRGMRMIVSDISEQGRLLDTRAQIEELNILLKEKFGKDLYATRELKKIELIKKRGVINNDKEYELVSRRFEELLSDNTDETQINVLDALLQVYQIKTGKV